MMSWSTKAIEATATPGSAVIRTWCGRFPKASDAGLETHAPLLSRGDRAHDRTPEKRQPRMNRKLSDRSRRRQNQRGAGVPPATTSANCCGGLFAPTFLAQVVDDSRRNRSPPRTELDCPVSNSPQRPPEISPTHATRPFISDDYLEGLSRELGEGSALEFPSEWLFWTDRSFFAQTEFTGQSHRCTVHIYTTSQGWKSSQEIVHAPGRPFARDW